MEQKIIGNRYQILESIGTGGMAEVSLSPEESAAVADAVASIPRGRLE